MNEANWEAEMKTCEETLVGRHPDIPSIIQQMQITFFNVTHRKEGSKKHRTTGFLGCVILCLCKGCALLLLAVTIDYSPFPPSNFSQHQPWIDRKLPSLKGLPVNWS